MADQWAWWRASVTAGKTQPVYEDRVESGFFRMRKERGGPWVPVAVWRDTNGKLLCLIGHRGGAELHAEDAVLSRWMFIARCPIAHAVYLDAYNNGVWPERKRASREVAA